MREGNLNHKRSSTPVPCGAGWNGIAVPGIIKLVIRVRPPPAHRVASASMRDVVSSSIVPGRSGDVVYLVLDDFGPIGKAYRETDPDEADEKAIIDNLISGQYSHPQRVIAFSLTEGFARDVTADVALKVLKRALAEAWTLPQATRELVERVICADVPAEVRG
jgi:hypothetical protein